MRHDMPGELLTIGEFAEISEVPAKTLRYYDRIELFEPDFVDPSTNYRYYSPDQLPSISQILVLKDLGLSLEQIGHLLEDDLPLAELRGMLRLKSIEIREALRHRQAQLARVEKRLNQIEEARFKARGEEEGTMRTCGHCGRRVREDDLHGCSYCGKPLSPVHADFLPVDKPPRQLVIRSAGLLLAALTLVAIVAGLVTAVAGSQGGRQLIFRPPAVPRQAAARLALQSIGYERVKRNGAFVFRGQIENISSTTMEETSVVISLYDADPGLIKTGRSMIERSVLSPGESSTSTMDLETIPRAHYYGVIFQDPSGSVVPFRDDRTP